MLWLASPLLFTTVLAIVRSLTTCFTIGLIFFCIERASQAADSFFQDQTIQAEQERLTASGRLFFLNQARRRPCLKQLTTIGVFGATNAGKSSLLNVFIGKPLLSSSYTAETVLPCLIRSASVARAQLLLRPKLVGFLLSVLSSFSKEAREKHSASEHAQTLQKSAQKRCVLLGEANITGMLKFCSTLIRDAQLTATDTTRQLISKFFAELDFLVLPQIDVASRFLPVKCQMVDFPGVTETLFSPLASMNRLAGQCNRIFFVVDASQTQSTATSEAVAILSRSAKPGSVCLVVNKSDLVQKAELPVVQHLARQAAMSGGCAQMLASKDSVGFISAKVAGRSLAILDALNEVFRDFRQTRRLGDTKSLLDSAQMKDYLTMRYGILHLPDSEAVTPSLLLQAWQDFLTHWRDSGFPELLRSFLLEID